MPKSREGGGGGSGGSRYSPTGLYTGSGAPINNASAYAATGAPTYSSSGKSVGNASSYAGAVQSRRSQNTDTPTHLYHYTSSSAIESIKSAGTINASTRSGDCALGSGAYFTVSSACTPPRPRQLLSVSPSSPEYQPVY